LAQHYAAPNRKTMIDEQKTIIVIPARMASTRLPGKPLADIHGAPMIVHVWRRAMESGVGAVLVAAAESAIAQAIWDAGGDAIVTEPRLPSGSDRAKAALDLRDPDKRYTHVINVQGDLPTLDPALIRVCLDGLAHGKADIATIACEITPDREAEIHNVNVVKAIASLSDDQPTALAYNFQRRIASTAKPPFFHHIGIYAYHRAALERFVKLPPSAREKEHALEQLRAMDAGMRIAVTRVDTVPLGVDTREDLEAARALLKRS
jgi:3-deoxy-manno-octulosonate cytidylyltransferase (CMP-KDO synthetase)